MERQTEPLSWKEIALVAGALSVPVSLVGWSLYDANRPTDTEKWEEYVRRKQSDDPVYMERTPAASTYRSDLNNIIQANIGEVIHNAQDEAHPLRLSEMLAYGDIALIARRTNETGRSDSMLAMPGSEVEWTDELHRLPRNKEKITYIIIGDDRTPPAAHILEELGIGYPVNAGEAQIVGFSDTNGVRDGLVIVGGTRDARARALKAIETLQQDLYNLRTPCVRVEGTSLSDIRVIRYDPPMK